MTDEHATHIDPFNEESASSCCNEERCCGPQTPIKRVTPKIGRNDPCPCDSGRKYKKCCGLNA